MAFKQCTPVKGKGPYVVDLYFDRSEWPEGFVIVAYRGENIDSSQGPLSGNVDTIIKKEMPDGVLWVRLWCGKPDTFSRPGQVILSIAEDVPGTKKVFELEYVFVG